jgi:hypothetical protein
MNQHDATEAYWQGREYRMALSSPGIVRRGRDGWAVLVAGYCVLPHPEEE